MNLSENKLQSPHKIIITSLGVILTSLGIFYFIITPTQKKIKNLKNEILIQKINFEKNLEEVRNSNKINEQFSKITPDLEKLENTSINKNNKLEFITTIENIAHKNNLIQKIDLTPAGNIKIFEKTKLSLTLSGEYMNFIKYLSDINKLDYYINIQSIEISKISSPKTMEQQKESNLHIKINADTYWR